jgi:protease PrsW
MTLLFSAVAPAVALLIVIYRLDRRNPEPFWLLLRLYVLGMLSVLPILLIGTILSYLNMFQFFDTDINNFYSAFIIAGFTEEIFKWIIVFLVAYKHKAYDEPLDGIVYSVFVSLGFATVENILYVLEGSYSVAIMRALLSVPAHMLFAVAMGYYLSMSKFVSDGKNAIFVLKSLIVPMILHGTYNYLLMTRFKLLLLLFIPYVLWMWKFNLKKIKKFHTLAKFASAEQ